MSTTKPAAPSRRSRLAVLAGLLLAVVAVVVAVRVWDREPAAPEPPTPDLSHADPALRELIESGQKRVRENPKSAAEWGRLGMAFYSHIFGPEALACFEQAERLDPHNPRWPYFQALIHRAADPVSALPKLRQAVELYHDETDRPRVFLAELLLQTGETDAAREQFRRLVEQQADHPRAHLGLARLEFQSGDLRACRDHLRYAYDGPHTRKSALVLSAETYQRAGDAAAARRDRAQAAGLPDDLDWPDAYAAELVPFQVGESARIRAAGKMLDRGQPAEAARLFQEIVRDYPQSATGWLLLGWANFNSAQTRAAEEALRKSLALDPTIARAWMYLALVRAKQGDRADAVNCLRTAVQSKPSYLEAHFNLGVLLKESGDQDGAVAAFEDALKCQPLNAQAHAQLGEVLWKQGKATEAREHLEQAAELNPKDAAVRKLLEEVQAAGKK